MTIPNNPSQPSNPMPVPPPYVFKETSTPAIISLIFGILSFVMLPVVGAIVAIILGITARREIAASNGRLTGDGLALAGLILGWVHIGLFLLAVAVVIGILILGITSIGHGVSSGGLTLLLISRLI